MRVGSRKIALFEPDFFYFIVRYEQVSSMEGAELARVLQCPFFETSAKTGCCSFVLLVGFFVTVVTLYLHLLLVTHAYLHSQPHNHTGENVDDCIYEIVRLVKNPH